jgi:heme/copper-type cytochrome/quinol oxidase subunit 4
LVLAAAVVAPASFIIRLIYPYGSESGFTDLNFWEWPACIAVFALGINASRQGWVTAVPDHLARQCRVVTLLAAMAMGTLLVTVGFLDAVDDAAGGWHWPAAGFAVVDAVLTIFGSVWLLSVAQHRLDRRYRWGPFLSRSAYGAFMLQTIFLLGFAVALRPIGLPAEAKALVVAIAGVACSFAAAWLLISRVPGFSRVL